MVTTTTISHSFAGCASRQSYPWSLGPWLGNTGPCCLSGETMTSMSTIMKMLIWNMIKVSLWYLIYVWHHNILICFHRRVLSPSSTLTLCVIQETPPTPDSGVSKSIQINKKVPSAICRLLKLVYQLFPCPSDENVVKEYSKPDFKDKKQKHSLLNPIHTSLFWAKLCRGGQICPHPLTMGYNGREGPKLSWNLISYRD